MTSTFSLWEFLSRDVTFLGGPHSPMLSWLGVFGIVLFFLWHILKLKNEVRSVRRAFERVRPMLVALAKSVGRSERDRFTHHPAKGSALKPTEEPSRPCAVIDMIYTCSMRRCNRNLCFVTHGRNTEGR